MRDLVRSMCGSAWRATAMLLLFDAAKIPLPTSITAQFLIVLAVALVSVGASQ